MINAVFVSDKDTNITPLRLKIAAYYNNNRGIITILILGLVLRLFFFAVSQPWEESVLKTKILIGDAKGYNRLANELIETGSLKSSSYSQFRTPGYPFFISIIYSIFGNKPWVVLLIQNFINAISLLGIFYLSRIFFNDNISYLSTILYTFDPLTIFYSNTLLTETLFSFILVYSIYSLFMGLKKERLKYFMISGILLGVCTLIRPITLYFPFVMFAIIFIYQKTRRSFRYYAIIVFTLLFTVTIIPWMIRNYINYGYLNLTSFKGYNLLYYNATATEYYKTGESFRQIRKSFTQKAKKYGAHGKDPSFKNSEIYNIIAKEYLLENWKIYLPLHLRGMLVVFLDPGIVRICEYLGIKSKKFYVKYNVEYKNISGMIIGFFKLKPIFEILLSIPVFIYLSITYLGFAIGWIELIFKRKFIYTISVITIIFYFTLLPGIIGQARYRIPIVPFYIIISAYGLLKILEKWNIKLSRTENNTNNHI